MSGRKFFIVSEMNGKALDINGGNASPGAKVIMWPRKSSSDSNQLWYFDGQGIIRSALNGFVMDPAGGGGKITMAPYTGKPSQQWRLEGNRIMNRANECLDIVGESTKDGADLTSYRYKGSANQHWRLQYV